jgi:hypothetical protein
MHPHLISSISCLSFLFSDLNLFLDNPAAVAQEVTQITLIIVSYGEGGQDCPSQGRPHVHSHEDGEGWFLFCSTSWLLLEYWSPLAWSGRALSLAVLVVVSFSSLSGHCVERTSHDPLDRTSRVLCHPSLVPGPTRRPHLRPLFLS